MSLSSLDNSVLFANTTHEMREEMPTITAINPSQKRENRYEIFLDGVLFVSVGSEIIGERKLWLGVELDEEGKAALEREAQILKTLDRALLVLNFRSRAV